LQHSIIETYPNTFSIVSVEDLEIECAHNIEVVRRDNRSFIIVNYLELFEYSTDGQQQFHKYLEVASGYNTVVRVEDDARIVIDEVSLIDDLIGEDVVTNMRLLSDTANYLDIRFEEKILHLTLSPNLNHFIIENVSNAFFITTNKAIAYIQDDLVVASDDEMKRIANAVKDLVVSL